MLTQKAICHIIYDDLRPLGLQEYIKYHLPDARVDSDVKVEEEGRIVIRPKLVSNDKTYFNNCVVEVNIVVPDMDDEASPLLDTLFKRAAEILNDDRCGNKDGDFYRYSIQRFSTEDEPNLNCHYINITVLFEILNVRRKTVR